MSYQFIHYETYARSVSKKSRGKKWTVKDIIAELCRLKNDCYHVENPQQPFLIYGMEYEKLYNYINDLAENTKNTDGRKIRKDQAILLAGVVSFPRELREKDENRYQEWIKENLDYLKEKFGDNLINVTEHNDEAHPHLHFYVINKDNCLKADLLHAGKVAKNSAYEAQKIIKKENTSEEKNIAENGEKEEKMSKLGNRLYREAMRAEQDEYYEKVGKKIGLTKIGPGRRRLSRAEWLAEKQMYGKNYEVKKELEEMEKRKLASTDFVGDLEEQKNIILSELNQAIEQKQKEISKAKEAEAERNKILEEAEKGRQDIEKKKKIGKKLNVSINRLKKEEKQLKNITKNAVGYGEKVNHFLAGLFGDSLQQKIDKAVEAIKKEFDLKLKSKDDKIEEQQKTIKQQSKDIKEKDMKINNYDNLLRNNSREKRELQNKIGDLSNQLDINLSNKNRKTL